MGVAMEQFGARSQRVRLLTAILLALAGVLLLSTVATGRGGRAVRLHGVQMTVPGGWQRVTSASDGPVTDPRTLLVVGTAGVKAKRTQCQVGTYRVPPTAAVVVVVGWKGSNGKTGPGRKALDGLKSVTPSAFECFSGRGSAATLVIGRRQYQVNVMVGDSASKRRIADALAVGRSFRLAP
jgi:hypothetical protein